MRTTKPAQKTKEKTHLKSGRLYEGHSDTLPPCRLTIGKRWKLRGIWKSCALELPSTQALSLFALKTAEL
jgi:hypothetical protein